MYSIEKILILLLVSFVTSCATFDKNVINEHSVSLTSENLMLLNGTYKRKSINDNLNIRGYDNSNLFRCFFLKPDRYGWTDSLQNDFIKMEVINNNRIKISLIKNGIIEKSKTLKGKIAENTFEFKKRFSLIPLIFLNFSEIRKTRIELLQNGNLLVDTFYEAIANFLIFPWGANYYGYDLEFEKVK